MVLYESTSLLERGGTYRTYKFYKFFRFLLLNGLLLKT